MHLLFIYMVHYVFKFTVHGVIFNLISAGQKAKTVGVMSECCECLILE